ncbi:hypothetical protein SEMRO_2948_G340840.1 [Seminavis robusta]|uniref:Uncharacterized protein n=1 Tax=Seminavis robusta TaxID=568900 RepID=A0A9N8F3F0_9STRA|nr:hypothetical protein SEMRO_2948_G340840.1 [Seminavis robusta]|eukprot:Sro2948_g340840.1 n/a (148) ;mRNA; r:6737-7278
MDDDDGDEILPELHPRRMNTRAFGGYTQLTTVEAPNGLCEKKRAKLVMEQSKLQVGGNRYDKKRTGNVSIAWKVDEMDKGAAFRKQKLTTTENLKMRVSSMAQMPAVEKQPAPKATKVPPATRHLCDGNSHDQVQLGGMQKCPSKDG